MISSAIWNKYARVNFSKTNKSAQACRASTLCGLWKIYRCLFIPNCMRKIMWLPIINIHKKHNYNKNFDSVRVFSSFNGLAETDYHLYQIQTFSRPMFPNNHSAKNLEMCKDWFYMVTSLLKITRFTIISKSKCFWIHPRLQELGVYKKYPAVLKSGKRFEQPRIKDSCWVV